jgi:hypothetical protein
MYTWKHSTGAEKIVGDNGLTKIFFGDGKVQR